MGRPHMPSNAVAGPAVGLLGTRALVKPGDLLLACYTLAQCVLLLLLAKFVGNRSLSSCA